ncbi:MAG: hypothetical protein M9921_00300 [Fimbriimonadaceae bacterium]|nr:hypothetical protein [Chthonomonadaceae bacterium]MCO5295275.1 hypothetical protein [Fimbriimonadaceae bacterium]
MARKQTETHDDAPDTAKKAALGRKPRATKAKANAPAEEAPAKPSSRRKAAPESAETAPTKKAAPRTRKKIGAPEEAEPQEAAAAPPKKRASAKKDEPVARTRSRKKSEDPPEPAPEAKKPAPRSRRRKAAEPDDALAALNAEAEALDVLPPTWRPRPASARKQEKAEKPVEPTAESDAEEPEGGVRRRRRRRTRRGEEPEPTAAETVAEPTPEVPATAVISAPPLKPAIPVPDDAPQVVLRDGIPTLVRAGRVFPPLMFFGSSSDEKSAATVLDEMRQAGEAGIHLHSHLIEFEVDERAVDENAALAAYLLAKTLEVDPDAQVVYRIVFVAGRGWQERFPNGRYTTQDGSVAEPSVCDDEFWGLARECLALFAKKIGLLPASDHVLGVHLERGEWFFADGWGYDTSKAGVAKFREWTRRRYLNDRVALRAAWFDGSVEFDTLEVPTYQSPKEEPKFVRSSRKERRWVDYHLFLSDATVERIGDLAYAIKEASGGELLVGVSYGYTFEWSHPASGHLSLGKLLRNSEIDFIAGPPSYKTREPGGAAPFPGPIDSFALNGKLYISEEDFKTSIGQGIDPDDFNPVIKTPQALESVQWRGAGSALAHASGMCWMDLWGHGWLRTQGIWERGAAVRDVLVRRMAAPVGEPDVAVFIDERALAYLVDQKAFSLLVQNVRESVLRSGMSAAFYLLSDLAHREHFPESKLYVFLNAWDLRSELRAAIKSRLQRDNKVLCWLYAAGLFESGRESLERAREVTGIALKPQPFHSKSGTTILNRRHVLSEAFQDRTLVGGMQLEPSYFAIPEEATVLGEYSATGLPSFVVKEFNAGEEETHWTSVFMGEPVVTPALMRALGQIAGVHVWNYQDDVVHVRPPFLTVHCTGTGPRTIALPNKWSVYDLLHKDWIATDSTSLRFNAVDGTTHAFLVGVKSELEAILAANPDDLLRMEELPTKPDDTVRFDSFSFDVPIMKLGEFMEGGSDEDISEDFLLRPVVVEDSETELETTTTGRRRRRRRRRGGSDRSPAENGNGTATLPDPDLDVHVMFRKRE